MIITKLYICKKCESNIELYYNHKLKKYIGSCLDCNTTYELEAVGDEEKVMSDEI